MSSSKAQSSFADHVDDKNTFTQQCTILYEWELEWFAYSAPDAKQSTQILLFWRWFGWELTHSAHTMYISLRVLWQASHEFGRKFTAAAIKWNEMETFFVCWIFVWTNNYRWHSLGLPMNSFVYILKSDQPLGNCKSAASSSTVSTGTCDIFYKQFPIFRLKNNFLSMKVCLFAVCLTWQCGVSEGTKWASLEMILIAYSTQETSITWSEKYLESMVYLENHSLILFNKNKFLIVSI